MLSNQSTGPTLLESLRHKSAADEKRGHWSSETYMCKSSLSASLMWETFFQAAPSSPWSPLRGHAGAT